MGVTWWAAHSRQAVHSRKPRISVWRYESPGGPSTPPGGFWEFLEIRQSSTQSQSAHFK